MKMFVLLSYTYDYYEFEEFEQISSKKETLTDLANKWLRGSRQLDKEVTDSLERHEELASDEVPHLFIKEVEAI